MQLPPLIANPAQPQQRAGSAPVHGLLRPLFARLVDAGHPVHLLRRQYRCGKCMIPTLLCNVIAGFSGSPIRFAAKSPASTCLLIGFTPLSLSQTL